MSRHPAIEGHTHENNQQKKKTLETTHILLGYETVIIIHVSMTTTQSNKPFDRYIRGLERVCGKGGGGGTEPAKKKEKEMMKVEKRR